MNKEQKDKLLNDVKLAHMLLNGSLQNVNLLDNELREIYKKAYKSVVKLKTELLLKERDGEL